MDVSSAKTAVITGAANGLGRACALALARRGWKICLADIEMEQAEQTLRLVEEAGGSGEAYRCNVRHHEEVQAMADHVFASWGKVDLLMNNAGVYGTGCVGNVPMEDWERIIDTNLWGVIYGCHSFVPRMREQAGGHIVNIASSAGIVSAPETGPYSVSKAGVISLSEALRAELASFGIGVTVVCPLFFNSHLFSTMSTMEGTVLTDLSLLSAENTRTTADDIAAMVIRAVEKDRLYLFPQLSSKVFWLNKRLMPAVFHGLLAFLYKHDLLGPVLMRPARWGML
jgi:NAD(P)-dependent dehydrogenase (short-subunit alcohol dehydrogenase family)